MTQIVIDHVTRKKLRNANDDVEFVDEAGNVVGVFCKIPQPPYDPSCIPPMSPDEEDRRAAQPGKYTTEEVLRHLRSQ